MLCEHDLFIAPLASDPIDLTQGRIFDSLFIKKNAYYLEFVEFALGYIRGLPKRRIVFVALFTIMATNDILPSPRYFELTFYQENGVDLYEFSSIGCSDNFHNDLKKLMDQAPIVRVVETLIKLGQKVTMVIKGSLSPMMRRTITKFILDDICPTMELKTIDVPQDELKEYLPYCTKSLEELDVVESSGDKQHNH